MDHYSHMNFYKDLLNSRNRTLAKAMAWIFGVLTVAGYVALVACLSYEDMKNTSISLF